MAPTYLSALSLMLHPGTELRTKAEQGTFTPLSPYQMMSELVEILENIQTNSPIIFELLTRPTLPPLLEQFLKIRND